MEVQEHFYADNPREGPADAWTTLPGVAYYFIGNGRIQAAVQVASGGRGTPLGLAIMDPETFGPKSRSLSFDQASGLASTRLEIEAGGKIRTALAGRINARWTDRAGIPAVEAGWKNLPLAVREVFYYPDRSQPCLIREISIRNTGRKKISAVVSTGIRNQVAGSRLELAPSQARTLFMEYRLGGRPGRRHIKMAWANPPKMSRQADQYWRRASRVVTSSPLLNHLYRASLYALPATLAASGKLDGSVWQYNREWTRDQAMAAIGLVHAGLFEPAKVLLGRLFSQFVTEEGDTVDSSERRPPAECELDQNGAVLLALETYTLWTNDLSLLKKYWKKVRAAADFPLRDVFRHTPSGLLHNEREFWERHAAHGIEDGLELAYQLFVSMGLSGASRLALRLGEEADAARWSSAAQRLKKAMLANLEYSLVDRGAFIKRRKITGEIQNEVHPPAASGLPLDAPLFAMGRHCLNPDTSTALPAAWEFIPARSKLAQATLGRIESLWNQRWRGGGYGRYHLTSEPDSPGPWPFPSLFVARAYFEAGRDAKVWRVLRWLARTPGSRAGSWFEFYGPRPVPPYPQVGIVPWTWAEMIILFLHHLAGVRPEWEGLRLRPRLLQGLTGYRAEVRVRNVRVSLTVGKATRPSRAGFSVGRKSYPFSEDGIVIPYPPRNLRISARVPGSLRPT